MTAALQSGHQHEEFAIQASDKEAERPA
ncbi:hypothetical protein [Bradyrhizobium japonicum]